MGVDGVTMPRDNIDTLYSINRTQERSNRVPPKENIMTMNNSEYLDSKELDRMSKQQYYLDTSRELYGDEELKKESKYT